MWKDIALTVLIGLTLTILVTFLCLTMLGFVVRNIIMSGSAHKTNLLGRKSNG